MAQILVVDDEEAIRDVFEQAFSMAGYQVRSVENAEGAVELLENGEDCKRYSGNSDTA